MEPKKPDPRRLRAERSEQALVSLALRDPAVVDEVSTYGIEPRDFASPEMRAIWRGMVKDRAEGLGPDEASVLERQERELRGGPWRDWSHLSEVVGHAAKARVRRDLLEGYIRRVVEARERRDLLGAASELLAMEEDGEDAEAMRERLEGALVQLRQRGAVGGVATAAEVFHRGAEIDDARLRGDEGQERLTTGIADLDAKLVLHRGQYSIWAGRPSMGKTQVALSVAHGIASRHGAVLVCSVEMGRDSMATRLYGSLVAEAQRRHGCDARTARMHAAEELERVPLLLDTQAKSLSEVLSSIRVAHSRYGLCAVVVDYLQKMRLPKAERRDLAVADASQRLGELFLQLDVCGIVLSQVGRDVERRPVDKGEGRRPMMSDLRESGAIEQDADAVVMVYRHAVYAPTAAYPDRVELIVRKQRNGRGVGEDPTAYAQWRPGDGLVRTWDPETAYRQVALPGGRP